MSTNRPNRDEVQTAIFTLSAFIGCSVDNMEEYGKIDGVTLEEAVEMRVKFHEAMDVLEALNDAMPSNCNG